MNLAPSQVWLAVEPVDMRLGAEGLSLRVQESLGKAPCDGSAYAFCNKRGNRLKLLVWDGTGVWLAQRRLHRGRFAWPQCRTMGLAGQRCRLAAPVGAGPRAMEAVAPT